MPGSPGGARAPRGATICPWRGVSWLDAVRFCNALSRQEGLPPVYHLDGDGVECDAAVDGYRLPTEAEWEHACRAGTTGPRDGPLDEIAWHRGNSDEQPHSVGCVSGQLRFPIGGQLRPAVASSEKTTLRS